VNTAANVSVDGARVVVNHSCLSSGTGAYQCVSLLPMSSNPSTSLYLELELFDEELGRSVIASKVVELAAPSDEENQTAPGNGASGATATLTAVAMGGVLIIGLLVVVVLVRTRSRGGADTSIAAAEEVSEPSGGGLLARAEQLK
ncbi:MAG: hypothetical protein VYA29_02155, partial [Candidatus Thermoplasmatota archaeon]|nr:hypothetical protein [Candidatus Thermoplasmatota archaeon]